MSSGVLVRDVRIEAECDCTPDSTEHLEHEHSCNWSGVVDATIDPADLYGLDAQWTCPACGCEHITPEGL
jgi:hypothetical protein